MPDLAAKCSNEYNFAKLHDNFNSKIQSKFN